jgi:hypothetical protein
MSKLIVRDSLDPGELEGRAPIGVDREQLFPATPEGPSVMGAAFRQENLVASAANYLTRSTFESDPDHNSWDNIVGTPYEDRWENFVGSRSKAEDDEIKSQIDQEERDRATIASAGWGGVGASFLAGLLDPTILLPVGAPVKIGMGGKSAISAGKTALKYGALTGAAVGVQEAGLQATQEIRPWQDTALAVSGGVFLGAILGGAIGKLSAKQLAKLTEEVDGVRSQLAAGDDPIDPQSIGRIAAGADAGAAHVGGEGSARPASFGPRAAENFVGELGPVTRLQTHEFDEARETVSGLADAGMMLDRNKQGIATTPGGTVENRVTMWNGGLGKALREVDDAFAEYWYGDGQKRFAARQRARTRSEFAYMRGTLGNKLSGKQFREEVTRAMENEDAHHIPQVAKAAAAMRKHTFDPLFEAAVKARLLSKDVKVVGAKSYVTRMYNRAKIIAKQDEFHATLFRHFRARSGSDMIDGEVHKLVDEVINNIIGQSPFRMPGLDMVQGPRGPLRERVLDIDSAEIEEFLERDIETIARFYTRTMAPDVELATKFGDVQLSEPLRKLLDEKERRINAATSEAERTHINEQYVRARKDIEALRDRIRHTYALPDDVDGLPYRAMRIAQQANFLRLMGMMTVRAIPDLARPIMVHGLTSTFANGFAPLVRGAFRGTIKMARQEVKDAGTALDIVLDSRSRALADLFDDWQRGTRLERVIDATTNKFGLVSLMAPWNAAMKQFTGIMVINQVLKATEAVMNGTATAKQIRNLAADGIDENMARLIWQHYNDGGGGVHKGMYLPNTENWSGPTAMTARNAFRAAIVRDVDRTIVTPGLELPLWTSKPFGKMASQFKSFTFSATQRMLIAGLQQRDLAFLNGMALSLALGAFGTHFANEQIKGTVDTSKWSLTKWGVEAIDYSGVLTILSEVNNISEKMSRGRIGLSALTGEMASRYASRNAVGTLLGPTPEFLGDLAFRLPGALMNGDWSSSDTRALRKLLPYQNLFYIRGMLDKVEKATNGLFGIPEPQGLKKSNNIWPN